jgi:hypothetical protein
LVLQSIASGVPARGAGQNPPERASGVVQDLVGLAGEIEDDDKPIDLDVPYPRRCFPDFGYDRRARRRISDPRDRPPRRRPWIS